MAFKPEEDKLVYQATTLLNRYVGGTGTPWVMLKAILPDRKDATIKKRFQLLEVKMKSEITSFLNSFEHRYAEARKQGTVKEIKGLAFDLKYYLDWYNAQEAEEVAEKQTSSEFLLFLV